MMTVITLIRGDNNQVTMSRQSVANRAEARKIIASHKGKVVRKRGHGGFRTWVLS